MRAIRVGFWPPEQSAVTRKILALLGQSDEQPGPQDFVDRMWNRAERNVVLDYVNNTKFKHTTYYGYSKCRMCGCDAGCSDYFDGAYTWPQGYGHYIEDHHVKPPQSFIDHIKRRQQ